MQPLGPGAEIDGFRLGECMHVGSMASIYRLAGRAGPLLHDPVENVLGQPPRQNPVLETDEVELRVHGSKSSHRDRVWQGHIERG